ncbi:hypothetical protein ACRQ5D_07710 [Mucilaginibacter sp. P25]|uniref:hypothetical protein n=1 Tax=unclassified Mucilaginibacter TaxID=2617802 RepID=UPI003D6699B9
MVFKRPAGSRDDKPGKSSSRSSRSDDRPKKSASTPKGKATPNGEKKYFPDRKKHSKATGSVTISPKAILGAGNHLALKDQALSQGLTLAGLLPTATTGQKEILAATAQAKGSHLVAARVNLTAAGQQPAITTGRKEALAANHKAKRNLTHLHVPVHQPALRASLKEALAVMQGANVNLHQEEPRAASKNAKAVLKRNHHLAKDRHIDRMTGKTNRMPLKPCAGVKILQLKNQKTMG